MKIILKEEQVYLLKKHPLFGVSINDVIGYIDHSAYYDLYPNYSSEAEVEADYMYDKKQILTDEIENIFWIFENLPDPIPIYRTIKVNKLSDIDYDDLGSSWSFERESALDFAKNQAGGNVLLSGKINKSEVDWKETIKAYVNNTMGDFSSYAENEITVPYSAEILDLEVTPLNKKLTESNSPSNKILYHGTSANLKNFDVNKIGSGMGVQQYGWGIYFTDEIDVAKTYKNLKSNTIVHFSNGEILNHQEGTRNIEDYQTKSVSRKIIDFLPKVNNKNDLLNIIKNKVESCNENYDCDEWQNIFQFLKKNIIKFEKMNAGNIYKIKVNLNSLNLLDWNQYNSNHLYNQITSELGANFNTLVQSEISGGLVNGKFISSLNQLKVKDLYFLITKFLDFSQKNTSLLLYKLGYDGIKVNDKEGGITYVFFNSQEINNQLID